MDIEHTWFRKKSTNTSVDYHLALVDGLKFQAVLKTLVTFQSNEHSRTQGSWKQLPVHHFLSMHSTSRISKKKQTSTKSTGKISTAISQPLWTNNRWIRSNHWVFPNRTSRNLPLPWCKTWIHRESNLKNGVPTCYVVKKDKDALVFYNYQNRMWFSYLYTSGINILASMGCYCLDTPNINDIHI